MISYEERNGQLYVYLQRASMPGGKVGGSDGDIILVYPHTEGTKDIQDAKTIIDHINAELQALDALREELGMSC